MSDPAPPAPTAVTMSPMRSAVYPGSFDPLTNGHMDLIRRSMRLFDRLVIGVLQNEGKAPLFTVAERMDIIRDATRDIAGVEVKAFSGLLVNFVQTEKASVVIRGVRAVSDFEYEFQMALMNRQLSDSTETIFMMPAVEFSYVSSRLIKEVFRLGGDVSALVPPVVLEHLRRRIAVVTEA